MKSKPGLIAIGVCLVIALAAAGALADAPKDVPPEHPAYRAIQTLIDRGYLGVFQDGSFQGDRPVDRYTLASALMKVLNDVQSGKLALPNEEMKTLRQLATEFRAELVEVAGKTNALAQAQEKTTGELAIVREDTTRILGELYQQRQALDQQKVTSEQQRQALDQHTQALDQQSQALAALRQQVDALKAETAKQQESLTDLQQRVADDQEVAQLGKTVNEVLVPQLQALLGRQKSLEAALGGFQDLRAEFDSYRRATDKEVSELKAQNRNQLIGGILVAAALLMLR